MKVGPTQKCHHMQNFLRVELNSIRFNLHNKITKPKGVDDSEEIPLMNLPMRESGKIRGSGRFQTGLGILEKNSPGTTRMGPEVKIGLNE